MKLYLLQLALLQPLGVPIPGYLIQTDDGMNVLVDTGLPYDFIESPPGPMGPLQLEVEMNEEDFVVNRLAEIGLAPQDIDVMVSSHFDLDHAGNLALFEGSGIVVQRRHYEAAKNGHARSQMSREQWDAPNLEYLFVEGDTTLLPGIELVETSGHVPGHQSVLVRLPNTGPVLLTIDAAQTAAMMDDDTPDVMSNDENEEETHASTRKLAGLVESEGVALVIHGHDAQQWPTLRHSPEFYD